jgi:hypothetical protein
MTKVFQKNYFYIFIFLFNTLSSYASDPIVEKEIHWHQPSRESHDPKWHAETLSKVKHAYNGLIKLDPGSLRNVATFRLVLGVDNQVSSKTYDDIMFVSGGNEKITSALASSLKEELKCQISAQCIAHYCPTIPSKPKDFELRKNIVEFFGFEENLTKKQKADIGDAFFECLAGNDYFTEFKLSETAILKLQGSLSDSICYRQFDDKSDKRARELGLIDKTLRDMTSYKHVSDLFGKQFQLNFGDSEQTIRMFIGKISTNEKFDLNVTEVGPLFDLSKFNEVCKGIRGLHSGLKEGDSEKIEKLKALEGSVIPPINEWIEKYLDCRLEIASYYDMCGNCQATFTHDFEVKHHIATKILLMFFNTIKDQSNEAVIWCLKGWVYDPPKSKLILNLPKISLIVSSLITYGESHED